MAPATSRSTPDTGFRGAPSPASPASSISGTSPQGYPIRAFFVFDLGGFPKDAVGLDEAALKLWLAGCSGTPFEDLGVLQIAQVNLRVKRNDSDYGTPPIAGWPIQGWRAFDLTPLIAAALDEHAAQLDLRLAFSQGTGGDRANDRLEVVTGHTRPGPPSYYAP